MWIYARQIRVLHFTCSTYLISPDGHTRPLPGRIDLKKHVYITDHYKHYIVKRLALFRLHGSYDGDTLYATDRA